MASKELVSTPRALLLFLDGCRPDALLAAEAPSLKRLAFEGGAFSFHVDCGGLPLSGPCWASILTGVPQEQHPVTTNDLDTFGFDESGNTTVTPVPDCVCSLARGKFCAVYRRSRWLSTNGGRGADSQPEALPPTIFGRLASAGRKSALFTVGSWEGIGRICGAKAGSCKESLEGGNLALHHFPCELAEEQQSSVSAVDEVIDLLARTDSNECPHAVALYLHLIDGTGHSLGFGSDVPEYRTAISIVDGQVGRLLSAIERRKAAVRDAGLAEEDWLVVVTTDHGGTAQARMPREMRRAFADCACVQKGIPQTGLRGVHGLRELLQHTQTFQILGLSHSIASGEMLPAPRPDDIVPTVLQHLLREKASSHGLGGSARGLTPLVPEIPVEPADKQRRMAN